MAPAARTGASTGAEQMKVAGPKIVQSLLSFKCVKCCSRMSICPADRTGSKATVIPLSTMHPGRDVDVSDVELLEECWHRVQLECVALDEASCL